MSPISRRQALAGTAAVGVAVPLLGACGGSTQGTSAAAGSSLGATSGVPEGSGEIFADQQVVVTQPKPGEFKGFSSICTHQGCPVTDVTDTINCTCHGSRFSIDDGSVVQGPAVDPLPAVELKVRDGRIELA